MDPNECLKILRKICEEVFNVRAVNVTQRDREFAEHFDSLDAWLCRGGFLPKEWSHRNEKDKGDN